MGRQPKKRFTALHLRTVRTLVDREGLNEAARLLTVSAQTLGLIVHGEFVTEPTRARVLHFLDGAISSGRTKDVVALEPPFIELLRALLIYVPVHHLTGRFGVDRRTLRAASQGYPMTERVAFRLQAHLGSLLPSPVEALGPLVRSTRSLRAKVDAGVSPPFPGLDRAATLALLDPTRQSL